MTFELTFGGSRATSYRQLANSITYRVKLAVGADKNTSFIISERNQDKPLLFSDSKFIDVSDLEYLEKKIYKLGRKNAIRLLQEFGSIDKIRKADKTQLKEIRGIGKKLASRIIESL